MKFSFNNKDYYISKPKFIPTALFIIGLSILLSLSCWQFKRLEWKTNLINERTERFESEFKRLDQVNNPSENEFQRVKVFGEVLNEYEFFMPALSKNGNNGYHILTLLKEKKGKIIIFDTGWVPLKKKDINFRQDNILSGESEIDVVIRLPGRKGRFQPDNDVEKNFWFFVEPKKIQDLIGVNVEKKFYIEAFNDGPNGFPLGNQTRIYLRNNHLQYALTWLLMALSFIGVFAFAIVKRVKS